MRGEGEDMFPFSFTVGAPRTGTVTSGWGVMAGGRGERHGTVRQGKFLGAGGALGLVTGEVCVVPGCRRQR